jgi:hypothetical protein
VGGLAEEVRVHESVDELVEEEGLDEALSGGQQPEEHAG